MFGIFFRVSSICSFSLFAFFSISSIFDGILFAVFSNDVTDLFAFFSSAIFLDIMFLSLLNLSALLFWFLQSMSFFLIRSTRYSLSSWNFLLMFFFTNSGFSLISFMSIMF